MRAAWIALGLTLLTYSWWRALLAALLEDLRKAAVEPEASTLERGPGVRSTALVEAARTPLNRVLAFRGVERRVRARRRWEAGFGRRGL